MNRLIQLLFIKFSVKVKSMFMYHMKSVQSLCNYGYLVPPKIWWNCRAKEPAREYFASSLNHHMSYWTLKGFIKPNTTLKVDTQKKRESNIYVFDIYKNM